MSYIIGSFNLQGGSGDHKQIAHIIDQENFDVIALQETNPLTVNNILQYLNSDWKGFTNNIGINDNPGIWGFLWNSKRLISLDPSLNGMQNLIVNNNPLIYNKQLDNQFTSDIYINDWTKDDGKIYLFHDAFYGRFTTPINSLFELRLINCHLYHGANNTYKYTNWRDSEFRLLTGDIYNEISTHRYGNETSPIYTIILGDYNITCLNCNMNESVLPNCLIKTYQDQWTMASSRLDYDHFSFDKNNFNNSITHSITHVDAVTKYFNGDYSQYCSKISDHIPIKMEFH